MDSILNRFRAAGQPKYVLLYPLLMLVAIFMLFPSIYAWYLSFHKVTIYTFSNPEFRGLRNFLDVLTNREFVKSLLFTLRYTGVVVTIEVILGTGLALLLNRAILGKRLLITFLLLPMMVSPALLGIMFRLLLNEFTGPIAYYFGSIKLFSPQWVVATVMSIDVLQWTPFAFLIIYAALQTIPKEYYEAGSIDGAGPLGLFTHITFPMITRFLVITALFRGIDAFKTIDMIYVLTTGGPGVMTTTISLFIYKLAFRAGQLGKACAASILLLIVFSIPMVLILKQIMKKGT